jgi:fatty acid desaturase
MAINLPRSTYVSRLLFALVVCGVITWFHLWLVVLLYWILPLSTVLMAILYVRDVAEHFAMPSAGFQHSRTTRTSWLERLLVGQNGINYHAEHHLFPAVPFFRLKELHHLLMQNPDFRDKTVVTHGYFTGLVKEVTEEATQAHSYQVTQQ